MAKKSRSIKYICDKCDHIELNSQGDNVYRFVLSILVLLGLFSAMIVAIFGLGNVAGALTISSFHIFASADSDFDAREYATNHTTFDGRDSYVFAEELVTNMPRIRYVPANYYDLMPSYDRIISEGGDCKAVSTLFTRLMTESGYPARTDCSLQEAHCVSRIDYDGPRDQFTNTYLIVDLTIDTLELYNLEEDHWNTDPINRIEVNK